MSTPSQVSILGIQIDNLDSSEVIGQIEASIRGKQRLLVATPNTEFLMQSQMNTRFRTRLQNASLKAPDGVGLLWAATYLGLPWRGRIWSYWQMIYSGASLVFYPRFCRRLLKETVPGSRLVPKLASLGDENSWRIFLLGGAAGVGESVKAIWRREFPNLQVETSSADPNQPKVLEQIKSLEPHLILVAYGASDQLAWLEENLPKLPAPVVGIGIGGTLDMLAHARSIDSKGIGRAHQSPRLIEKLGLSWLWRLIMEPWRARRTIVAVPKFIGAVLEYKRSNI